ncbi:LOW QUALITY PROTEIN: hypothetical protein QTO34_018254 [Cnephaeus nilssonii]|uniref:Mitochondrial import receptor subunit TOM40 homolog n=1 Tax=Cnephaeus nilssonii TaxID=3371016 RepID=A0AA40HYH7_CNENI|nr:LOW QUALITY PROTEIN: hypothetical protein QTO34_018254 [Eptesicus nilssonii]
MAWSLRPHQPPRKGKAAAAGSVVRGARAGLGARPPAPFGNALAASSPPAGPHHCARPHGTAAASTLSSRLRAAAAWGRPGRRGPGGSRFRTDPGTGTAEDGACGCLPTRAPAECHRKCQELFPLQVQGVELTVNKGLRSHFQVNHTVALSTVGASNYHFGVTYVGTKQLSPTEAFPVLVGDMDSSGGLRHSPAGPGLRSKKAIQTQQSKFVNWPVDGESRGSDFTAAVPLGSPDVLVGSGILEAHFLQSITPCLALSRELVDPGRPGEEGTVVSLAGKYTLNNWLATDSNAPWTETGSWVPPLPLTLALGAFLNHRKNKFQCGFGLTIG